MIPTFTLVTTIGTIAITGILVLILMRINAPMMRRRREGGGETSVVVDGGTGRSRDDGNDGGSDGGGDGGGD